MYSPACLGSNRRNDINYPGSCVWIDCLRFFFFFFFVSLNYQKKKDKNYIFESVLMFYIYIYIYIYVCARARVPVCVLLCFFFWPECNVRSHACPQSIREASGFCTIRAQRHRQRQNGYRIWDKRQGRAVIMITPHKLGPIYLFSLAF